MTFIPITGQSLITIRVYHSVTVFYTQLLLTSTKHRAWVAKPCFETGNSLDFFIDYIICDCKFDYIIFDCKFDYIIFDCIFDYIIFDCIFVYIICDCTNWLELILIPFPVLAGINFNSSPNRKWNYENVHKL